MGIIKDYRQSNKAFGTYNEPAKNDVDLSNAKILDLTYMKKLIGDVLDFHKTDVTEKELKGNRTWTYVQNYRLQNILGYVDTPTFVFMLESAIEWCIDCRTSVQPNGKWELYRYEVEIERIEKMRNKMVGKTKDGSPQTVQIAEPVQRLVIGFQFIDIKGEKDLQYEMGRPKAYSDQQITPAMLKEILANQGSKVSEVVASPDVDKYKELVQQQQEKIAQQDANLLEMKDQMSTMQEMVAGLITELQTARSNDIVEETPPQTKKTVKKRGK